MLEEEDKEERGERRSERGEVRGDWEGKYYQWEGQPERAQDVVKPTRLPPTSQSDIPAARRRKPIKVVSGGYQTSKSPVTDSCNFLVLTFNFLS